MAGGGRRRIEEIWNWLGEVADPEIPTVSVVDLGIVRDVAWIEGEGGDECVVTITPTYSGCPATEVIAEAIAQSLRDHGIQRVRLDKRIAPAWSSDWISEAGRHKLRAAGIAPPAHRVTDKSVIDIRGLRARAQVAPKVACPHCGSGNTQMTSQFGSTACKALYRCRDCLEPFDYFKCH